MYILETKPYHAARSLDDRSLVETIKALQFHLNSNNSSHTTQWVKANKAFCTRLLVCCGKEFKYRHGAERPDIPPMPKRTNSPRTGEDGVTSFATWVFRERLHYMEGIKSRKRYWTNRRPPRWYTKQKTRLIKQPETATEGSYHKSMAKYDITRLAFSGRRDPMPKPQLRAVKDAFQILDPISVHHGCCVGADEQVHTYCLGGYRIIHPKTYEIITEYPRIIGYPPTSKELRMFIIPDQFKKLHPPASYHERNRHLVDNAEFLVAAPASMSEKKSPGTWYTINYARTKNIPVLIVTPEGRFSYEDGMDKPQEK